MDTDTNPPSANHRRPWKHLMPFSQACTVKHLAIAIEKLTGTAHQCRLQKTESQVREQVLRWLSFLASVGLVLLGEFFVGLGEADVCFALQVQEFELQLKEVLRVYDLGEMVIRMGNRAWAVPINDLHLDAQRFADFIGVLQLEFLDCLLVIMLPTAKFRVVVVREDVDVEKLYAWY
ncbi:hypothetical protein RHSIM_Rhsim10G0016200 [Rhododendron simsii]|uniref:Uncharacterized protein n=1 Tax=Rhododendron simsii TaxID=118357 RepID=A0A834GAV7_RHOSS|nr:hypothetical protein RHSIM_Rhsim10G0016200 [Rhododendron simsii]